MGFAGEAFDDNTQEVSGLMTPEAQRRIWTNGGFILCCLLVPMAGYLTIVGNLQLAGYFQPMNMFVTLGDEVNFLAQSHNGLYTRTLHKHYYRYIYKENNTRGLTSGYFVYCDKQGHTKWTFLPLTDEQFGDGDEESVAMACNNDILAYSQQTTVFAPFEDPDGWKIRSPLGQFTDLGGWDSHFADPHFHLLRRARRESLLSPLDRPHSCGHQT